MRTRRAQGWLAFGLAAATLLLPFRAAGQTGSTPPAPDEPTATESEQQYQFAVEIKEVTVPVTVTNSSGEFVTDLNKNELTVYDNGAEQQIEEFDLSWDPISLAIVVQTSARVESQF